MNFAKQESTPTQTRPHVARVLSTHLQRLLLHHRIGATVSWATMVWRIWVKIALNVRILKDSIVLRILLGPCCKTDSSEVKIIQRSPSSVFRAKLVKTLQTPVAPTVLTATQDLHVENVPRTTIASISPAANALGHLCGLGYLSL